MEEPGRLQSMRSHRVGHDWATSLHFTWKNGLSVKIRSFIEPIFAWNVPLVCQIFLKRSLVFHILFFSSISLHWSLRKAFLSLLAILLNSAFKWVYLFISPLLFCLNFRLRLSIVNLIFLPRSLFRMSKNFSGLYLMLSSIQQMACPCFYFLRILIQRRPFTYKGRSLLSKKECSTEKMLLWILWGWCVSLRAGVLC